MALSVIRAGVSERFGFNFAVFPASGGFVLSLCFRQFSFGATVAVAVLVLWHFLHVARSILSHTHLNTHTLGNIRKIRLCFANAMKTNDFNGCTGAVDSATGVPSEGSTALAIVLTPSFV